MIIYSRLRWYGHIMHGDTKFQTGEVMEAKITGKRKKVQPIKLWEKCVKRIRNNNAWEEGLRTFERNYRKKLEQKLLTPASKDNGIKTVVVVVAVILISRCISTYGKLLIFSLAIKNPMNWLVQIFDRFVMPNRNFRNFYFSQNFLQKLEIKIRLKKGCNSSWCERNFYLPSSVT